MSALYMLFSPNKLLSICFHGVYIVAQLFEGPPRLLGVLHIAKAVCKMLLSDGLIVNIVKPGSTIQ